MSRIPIALCGVDHPHICEWYDALQRVPDLQPVAHYDPGKDGMQRPPLDPFHDLPLYRDLSTLLAHHDVQAALVAQSLRETEETLLTLASAGVHVMVEKPVARTAAALQRVRDRWQPGTIFYTGYLWRLEPMIQEIRSLVEEGILGDLWSVEMHWLTSKVGLRPGVPAHRNPNSYVFKQEISRGGMLQWLGCHFIDLMSHLTGLPVKAVSAMTARQTTDEIEVEDTATCLLQYGNGMLGSLHLGYLLPSGGHQFLGLRGSLGWVSWDWETGRQFTVHSEHPTWKAAPQRTFDFPHPADAGYGGGTAEILLRDLARCIRQGGTDPIFTIDDALRVLEVLDAAYESAGSGKVVEVSR